MSYILGIESSCDETAASIVLGGTRICSNVVFSQIKIHQPYGGVVPELASRAHIQKVWHVCQQALDQARVQLPELAAVAVTLGPGLIGSLLVGVEFAKALAYTNGLPLITINHLAAHLYSVFLSPGEVEPEFPYLGLVVSGGHTSLILARSHCQYELVGETLDDAAGEAYDKVAKLLGLGYPGGPIIDQLAQEVQGEPVVFPRPYLDSGDFHFSFSGLKTAVVRYVQKHGLEEIRADPTWLPRLLAGFQASVVEVLVGKLKKAVAHFRPRMVVVAGGVAANRGLRHHVAQEIHGAQVLLPPLELCTDNAAMIAGLAWPYYQAQEFAPLDVNADAQLPLTPLHKK